VHGDSIGFSVERREQTDDLILTALPKKMKAPGTVFAAAP
jgi:hypothetical protein